MTRFSAGIKPVAGKTLEFTAGVGVSGLEELESRGGTDDVQLLAADAG